MKLAGMAGTHRQAAQAAVRRFGMPDLKMSALVSSRRYRPGLHRHATLSASSPGDGRVRAGKHVICEKPSGDDGGPGRRNDRLGPPAQPAPGGQPDAAVQPALRGRGQLVNRRRWASFCTALSRTMPPTRISAPTTGSGIDQKWRHFHRAWRAFLRLFAGWFGPGRVVAAQTGRAPRVLAAHRGEVHCTVRYGSRCWSIFITAFTRPVGMDRQELWLVFERGDVTLYEWVPTRVRVHAIADEAQTRTLCDLFPGARLDALASYGPRGARLRGPTRHSTFTRCSSSHGARGPINPSATELLRAMLADQLAWVRDPSHRRIISEDNGRDSLAVACAADRMPAPTDRSHRGA